MGGRPVEVGDLGEAHVSTPLVGEQEAVDLVVGAPVAELAIEDHAGRQPRNDRIVILGAQRGVAILPEFGAHPWPELLWQVGLGHGRSRADQGNRRRWRYGRGRPRPLGHQGGDRARSMLLIVHPTQGGRDAGQQDIAAAGRQAQALAVADGGQQRRGLGPRQHHVGVALGLRRHAGDGPPVHLHGPGRRGLVRPHQDQPDHRRGVGVGRAPQVKEGTILEAVLREAEGRAVAGIVADHRPVLEALARRLRARRRHCGQQTQDHRLHRPLPVAEAPAERKVISSHGNWRRTGDEHEPS